MTQKNCLFTLLSISLMTTLIFIGLSFQSGHSDAPRLNEVHPYSVTNDSYHQNIKPIFDSKCIACHACYNSPCQLNFTNYQGAKRGAHPKNPYDFSLTSSRQPTRLDIDASSTKQWRELGFYDIIGHEKKSLLLTTLTAIRDQSYSDYNFKAEQSRACLKPAFVPVLTLTGSKQYLTMPYGLPKLTEHEIKTIEKWIAAGAPGPSEEVEKHQNQPRDPAVIKKIKKWETWLNQKSPKAQISARYFYEHLFIAHIHLTKNSTEFFRLVRAKNKEGHPKEIATTRPFDDPKQKFYYRFKLINQSLVAKSHTTFLLDDLEENRFKSEFLEGDWNASKEDIPKYGQNAANPFLTFQSIPRKTRYKFFLENARYFIMTFMKGPVCRGQTALNVINDHFWVYFLDPDFDLSAQQDQKFNEFAQLMTPPSSRGDKIGLFNELRENRWKAHTKKWQIYKDQKVKFGAKSIWGGDQKNPNATLTIYRHFDSADVLYGNRGKMPQTIWVMDYQIFEDIYYNLVAGYNLFGSISHQTNTRLYMELSRITSEDMFLSFLPKDQRSRLRNQWSQKSPHLSEGLAKELVDLLGQDFATKMQRKFSFQSPDIEVQEEFKSDQPKLEFIKKLQNERIQLSKKKDYRWDQNYFSKIPEQQNSIPSALNEISNLKGPFHEKWPEVMVVRLESKNEQDDQVISLVANRGHYNVNMLFLEDKRRWPERDYIDVLTGIATSYPNFFLKVKRSEVDEFSKALTQLLKKGKDEESFKSFLKRYGVSRFNENFWQEYAWFNAYFKNQRPVEYGALDLNRYLSY